MADRSSGLMGIGGGGIAEPGNNLAMGGSGIIGGTLSLGRMVGTTWGGTTCGGIKRGPEGMWRVNREERGGKGMGKSRSAERPSNATCGGVARK